MDTNKSGFQQFLSLILSLMLILPAILSAKRIKHGARVIVIKKDDRIIDGELLKVVDSGLIIMSDSETGVTIPLKEIKKVKLIKKGKFITGFLIGVGASMFVGGIMGPESDDCGGIGLLNGAVFYGGMIGSIFGPLSGGISSFIKIRKTYSFESASPEELYIILNKLRSKARF